MTRKEAMFILMLAKSHTCNNELTDALDMAIKALEQEPKSGWEHDHEILKAYSDGAKE